MMVSRLSWILLVKWVRKEALVLLHHKCVIFSIWITEIKYRLLPWQSLYFILGFKNVVLTEDPQASPAAKGERGVGRRR